MSSFFLFFIWQSSRYHNYIIDAWTIQKSVGILPVAHPTNRGLRIAQQSERTTQKAHAWYISIPCVNLLKTYNVYIQQITAGYNIPTVNIYRCLVLWLLFVSCEVTIRQRQASSKRSLCKVTPTHYPSRASASVMQCKITDFFRNINEI